MVYAIFSGCYSDWRVHGYFTNPDDAYAFCEYHNKDRDCYDEYYVMPLNEMTIDFNERPNIHYKFTFYAFVDGGVIGETMLDEVYTLNGGMCPNNSIDKMEIYRFLSGNKKETNYRYSVEIYMKEYNYEKAYKIASDMIYKKVAEDLQL